SSSGSRRRRCRRRRSPGKLSIAHGWRSRRLWRGRKTRSLPPLQMLHKPLHLNVFLKHAFASPHEILDVTASATIGRSFPLRQLDGGLTHGQLTFRETWRISGGFACECVGSAT